MSMLLVGCPSARSVSIEGHRLTPDRASPLLIWATREDAATQHSWDGIPSVANGRVYVMMAYGFAALATADGHIIWRDSVLTQHAAPGSHNVVTRSGLVCTGRFDAVCVEASDGRLRWRYTPERDEVSHLAHSALDDSSFYIGLRKSGAVVALDVRTGRPRWRADLRQGSKYDLIIYGITAADGTVFVGTDQWLSPLGGTSVGAVVALDARDGHELWSYRTTGPHGAISGAPALTDRILVAGDVDGHAVIALERATGKLLWRTTRFGPGNRHITPEHEVVIHRDTVYAGSRDGGVYALDIGTGRVLWDRPTGSAVTYVATCADKVLAINFGLIVTHRGTHRDVRAPTGAQKLPNDFLTGGFAVENDSAFVVSDQGVYGINCAVS